MDTVVSGPYRDPSLVETCRIGIFESLRYGTGAALARVLKGLRELPDVTIDDLLPETDRPRIDDCTSFGAVQWQTWRAVVAGLIAASKDEPMAVIPSASENHGN